MTYLITETAAGLSLEAQSNTISSEQHHKNTVGLPRYKREIRKKVTTSIEISHTAQDRVRLG